MDTVRLTDRDMLIEITIRLQDLVSTVRDLREHLSDVEKDVAAIRTICQEHSK